MTTYGVKVTFLHKEDYLCFMLTLSKGHELHCPPFQWVEFILLLSQLRRTLLGCKTYGYPDV